LQGLHLALQLSNLSRQLQAATSIYDMSQGHENSKDGSQAGSQGTMHGMRKGFCAAYSATFGN
jgi:hypothetical protein